MEVQTEQKEKLTIFEAADVIGVSFNLLEAWQRDGKIIPERANGRRYFAKAHCIKIRNLRQIYGSKWHQHLHDEPIAPPQEKAPDLTAQQAYDIVGQRRSLDRNEWLPKDPTVKTDTLNGRPVFVTEASMVGVDKDAMLQSQENWTPEEWSKLMVALSGAKKLHKRMQLNAALELIFSTCDEVGLKL